MDNGVARIIRIMLVDDHTLVRAGLRMVIESRPGFKVVAEAANRDEALLAAHTQRPDIILLDLDLGYSSGLELIPDLLAKSPSARILILTGVMDVEQHRQAVRMGAVGLVLKEQAVETAITAIEKVYNGEVWLDQMLIARVLQDFVRPGDALSDDPEAQKIAALKPREREVIALIGEGMKNQQIADRLNISEATVRHHLTSIFSKLEVDDRVELLIYAYRHGLAQLPK